MPVSFDQSLAAARTGGRSTFPVMDIAGVDVPQAIAQSDTPRPLDGIGRCPLPIIQFVGGMKRREMQGDFGAQVIADPARHGVEFGITVVEPGNQERGDLQPTIRIVIHRLQRVEHRSQVSAGLPDIEIIRECFQIDIGRIHF